MSERNAESRPELVFQVMDITDMSVLDSNTFDLAVDKSTIDALLCGDDAFMKVAQMLKETQRVLKPGGHYFAISYGRPESRSFHFVQPFLSFENREFVLYDQTATTEEEKNDRCHFIYVSKKLPDADEVSAANYDTYMQQMMAQAEAEKLAEEM